MFFDKLHKILWYFIGVVCGIYAIVLIDHFSRVIIGAIGPIGWVP